MSWKTPPAWFMVSLLVVTALVLGLALYGRGCKRSSDLLGMRTVRVTDTVRVAMPPDTIRVRELRPVTVWREPRLVIQTDTVAGRIDTVLIAEPFTAPIDTTLPEGRVRFVIAFPPLGVRDLSVVLRPDTMLVVHDSVTVTVRDRAPWYEEAGKLLGAAAVGYGARWLTEPRSSTVVVTSAGPAARVALLSLEVRL